MLEIKKLSNNKKALLEKAKNKFILMKTKEVAPKNIYEKKIYTWNGNNSGPIFKELARAVLGCCNVVAVGGTISSFCYCY